MRKLHPVGVVLLAGVLAHAQEAPAPTGSPEEPSSYRFDGQLVYRASDGTFFPLLPDAVFFGWGDAGCRLTDQSSERLNVYPDGIFHLSISPLVTTEFVSVGKTPFDSFTFPSTGAKTFEWPCYRFRVAGCDDRVVHFGPTPPSSRIELSCPSRERAEPLGPPVSHNVRRR